VNDRERPTKAPSTDAQGDCNPILAAALELAAAGWLVFPVHGKAPATPHGFKDAVSDEAQIRAWWQRWPGCNVAIAVPDGMVVIDIDPRDGGELTLSGLEQRHGTLPPTLTTLTGSGGEHRWFKTPTEGLLQADLGKGLQTRVGGKGYVVAPPSIHPQTQLPYEWLEPLSAVAPLPLSVHHLLRPPAPPLPSARTTFWTGSGGFLDWAYERVARAPQGVGHDTLRSTARLAGGYVAAGLVKEHEARRTLLDALATWQNPYPNGARTIDDALEHGRLTPVRS
jgi:Bifunctional DNA primase/polymerase, N-terminal